MKKIKLLLTPIMLILGLATAIPISAVEAQSPAQQIQSGVNGVGGNDKNCKDADGNPVACTLGSQLKTVINILLFILGAIAVIMVVIGGIRYTTANGDTGQIKTARDTILYAVVGLVVALLAYAIVNFVVSSFVPTAKG